MIDLKNLTPYPAMAFSAIDQHDNPFSIVVARISYDLNVENCQLTLCQDQGELMLSDMHYGEPGLSSVEFESDLAPYKPNMDVIINANAFSPDDRPVPSFTVSAQIGEVIRVLRIYGPRKWKRGIISWNLSKPENITSIPLKYEYSSGGMHQKSNGSIVSSVLNPVGMGWYPTEIYNALSPSVDSLPAPQIEWDAKPLQNIDEDYQAAGFGFYGRGWEGRLGYAGTYDDSWKSHRHPFLPRDFSFNYWCGAHPSLQFPHPEPLSSIIVTLNGLVSSKEKADQMVKLNIPVESLCVAISLADKAIAVKDMVLDTMIINMLSRKVHCSYRMTISEYLKPNSGCLSIVEQEQYEKLTRLSHEFNSDETRIL